MHYAVDAVSGIVVGVGASLAAPRLWWLGRPGPPVRG
jgi:hypothetical protein